MKFLRTVLKLILIALVVFCIDIGTRAISRHRHTSFSGSSMEGVSMEIDTPPDIDLFVSDALARSENDSIHVATVCHGIGTKNVLESVDPRYGTNIVSLSRKGDTLFILPEDSITLAGAYKPRLRYALEDVLEK